MEQAVDSSIEQYLHLVRKKLGDLPDTEIIIQELRTHIWDLANNLSIKKGLAIQDAFTQALEQMEDPDILASKFLDVNTTGTGLYISTPKKINSWNAPSLVPDRKITAPELLIVAIFGFILTMFMATIVTITTSNSGIFVVTFILGIIATGGFAFFLYFQDERTFQEQLTKLKMHFEKNKTRSSNNITNYKNKFEKTFSNPTVQAFFEHFSALMGLIGEFFMLGIILYLSFTDSIPIFNNKWYPTGMTIVLIMMSIQIIATAIHVFTGRIRISRLINGVEASTSGVAFLLLALYYPFTFGAAFLYFFEKSITDPKTIQSLTQIDSAIPSILTIIGILLLMSAIYNFIKYTMWKPTERRSLLYE